MSVSKWAYTPEVCDGEYCVGDCDLCDKPKVMEDEFEKCNSDGEKMVEKCDYIKREGAVRAVIDAKTGKDKTIDGTRQVTDCLRRIKDIPTADVRENITAQKVIGGGEHDGATCWFECSRCGKTVDVNDKYCSECGADFIDHKKDDGTIRNWEKVYGYNTSATSHPYEHWPSSTTSTS